MKEKKTASQFIPLTVKEVNKLSGKARMRYMSQLIKHFRNQK